MFKTHLWSLIGTNTPAIYHAAVSTLKPMDNLQNSYVHELGMSLEAAFLEYNVAPLCLRRDIAMLDCYSRLLMEFASHNSKICSRPRPPKTEWIVTVLQLVVSTNLAAIACNYLIDVKADKAFTLADLSLD